MTRIILLVLAAHLGPAPAAGSAVAPTAITACGSLGKGSYVLANNLSAAGDCLKLHGNFITIDLAGFVINGDGSGSGIRPGEGLSLHGIAIRNGSITNFVVGVDLRSVSDVLVERIRAVKNTSLGIRLGPNSIARDNIAEENGYIGVALQSGGEVTGNVASNNGDDGFFLIAPVIASGNMARANGSDGIFAGFGSTIVNNSVFGNDGDGLSIGCPSNVMGNTAVDNGGENILLRSAGCNSNNNVAP